MEGAPASRLVDPASSLLLVVDIQERLAPVIAEIDRVVARVERMIEAARLLGMPVIVTEQYPKGLGRTIERLDAACSAAGAQRFEKTCFGCLGAADVANAVKVLGARTMIITGVETHVCVMQTAVQALQLGLDVHVPRDAVGSRHEEDKHAGLERIRQAGAVLTTSEMTIFELVGDAANPIFKQVRGLVA